MAFLSANRPELNPKNRKMAELELDEEFLKQYRELQKEWEKTLAELAKALSKDPRLLARYMNLSRRNVDSLRDQLTLLNLRQQELLVPVEQLSGDAKTTAPLAGQSSPGADASVGEEPLKPRPLAKTSTAAGWETVRATLARDLVEIASGTAAVQEDLGTWLPLQMKPDDPRFAPLREQAARLSSTAALAATAARSPKAAGAATAAKKVDELSQQLKTFETALAGLANSDNPQLVVHVNRRLARVRKLQQLSAAWTQKNGHVAERRFHRALEIDQHRLSEDTLELTAKMETAAAQLAGLPDEVGALADEVKEALRYDVLVDQMSAELRLRDNDLTAAKTHQKKAIEGFTRAEERFNKLIDRIIEEQDKVPPQVPDLDNMQLPTLEELLGRLESEADLAELLGVPNRTTNLQGLRDWLMRNGSDPGAGNGMAAGAGMQARLAEQARRDALRAVRNAEKRDGAPRPIANTARWNTLGSRLEDVVRQGRGNTPPRQYRRAIERYFELISAGKNAPEPAAPIVPKKESAAVPGGSTKNSP
jgi:tetratricopeptide (TPR) repeat protein